MNDIETTAVGLKDLSNDNLILILKECHRQMVLSTFRIGDILIILGKRGITTKEASKLVGIPLSLCRIAVTLARKYEEQKRDFDMPVDIANTISKNARVSQVDSCIEHWKANPKMAAWEMKGWIRKELSIASAGGENITVGYGVRTDDVGRILPEVRKPIPVTVGQMLSQPVQAARPLGVAGPFYVIVGSGSNPHDYHLYVDGKWKLTGTHSECVRRSEEHLGDVLANAPGLQHTEPVDIFRAYRGAGMSAAQVASGLATRAGAMNLAKFLNELGVELTEDMIHKAVSIILTPDQFIDSIERSNIQEVVDLAWKSLDNQE